ncbi:MAG: nitrogenase cofactor biosynthesis protein NifB [Desulfobulbaceae bacterium]|nr:nitrogenase cofactor biosynthesis protein NifB [Desulfobulbaceae bacterium]
MENSAVNRNNHPCFNAGVKGQFGRVHLPVAPACNVKCNFCNRKYDCVNESRPGVTSTVLSPEQAVTYMDKVLAMEPRISVAGIAGPGDPFANAEQTMETLRLIRARHPKVILCLASNGLNLAPYVAELAEIDVSHVTVTVNAVDPEIGAKVYGWVRDGKVVYHGVQAGQLLLNRQLEAITALKAYNITVKINTIVIPGINDHHTIAIAKKMKELGADLLNCMAMFPNAGTPFGDIIEPSKQKIAALRQEAEKYLPQMRHCTRCRADAVGLLDEDRTDEMRGCLSACASTPTNPASERPNVAVATREGVLVNMHLGEADTFQIWTRKDGKYELVGERPAPKQGGGMKRWISLARSLNDCKAVLVNGVGEKPHEILQQSGLEPVTMNGFIESGLEAIYQGHSTSDLKGRRKSCAAGGCSGSGGSCM